jgi:hypothetical protein
MVCQTTDGIFLFLYESKNDSSCQNDFWFATVQDALEYATVHFGIPENRWSRIQDTVSGCFDDYVYPIPIKPAARQKALIQAANGELEWVRSLLSAGTNASGMPLMVAIQCNQPEIVQAMIKADADVNFEFDGTTPLIHAISSTYPEIVEILIKAGADVHKKARNGDSPLQVAKRRNRLDATDKEREAIIQMLASSGERS